MKDLSFVAVRDALQQLIGEALDDARIEALLLAEAVHVFLEVVVEELEDEHQFAVGVNDFSQRHDVRVREFLKDGNLANGR